MADHFIRIPKDRPDSGQQAAVKDFVSFAITKGQDRPDGLAYAKLADSIQKPGQALLSQLTANGQPSKQKAWSRVPWRAPRQPLANWE